MKDLHWKLVPLLCQRKSIVSQIHNTPSNCFGCGCVAFPDARVGHFFEGYIDDFRVTSKDLLARSLATHLLENQREFISFVASTDDNELLGYAVVYRVPFNYDLRANLVLKELYVSPVARGSGIRHNLFLAVLKYAREYDCAQLKWECLPDNFWRKNSIVEWVPRPTQRGKTGYCAWTKVT